MTHMSNSTVSLLQLWHLCIESQGVPREDVDEASTMLEWNTLRKALEGLAGRVEVLNCSSVDEIMQRHFSSRTGGCEPVSFTWYWRGMEAILHACGVFNGNLECAVEMKVQSLRRFRDAVLDELGACSPEVRVPITALRELYERLAQLAAQPDADPQPEVEEYWQEKISMLQDQDESTVVTADEIATALLSFLEELLKDSMGDIGDNGSDEDDSSDDPDRTPLEAGRSTSGLFGFGTADFGGFGTANFGDGFATGSFGNGLTGTADFGRLTADSLVLDNRKPGAKIDFNPGGSFGPGLPSPPPDLRLGGSNSNVPSWNLHAEPGERLEVRRFREQLARQIATDFDGSELFISQLYSSVRDVIEAQQEASTPGGGTTPRRRVCRAGICAGVRLLASVKNRWLRRVFRDWETQAIMDDSKRACEANQTGSCNLFVDLIASQAKTAETLERRACCVPFAYRLAWLLARARRRTLCGVLPTLVERLLSTSEREAIQTGLDGTTEDRAPAPAQATHARADTALHRFSTGRGTAARNVPKSSPKAGTRTSRTSPSSEDR